MTRDWRRVPTDRYCGYCGIKRPIPKGEPALFLTVGSARKHLVRCQECAGEKPPELPPLLESGGIRPALFASIGTASKHTVTTKQWMPYRDPGEEG